MGSRPSDSIDLANSSAWIRSGFSSAELVGEDLDQRRLRRAVQPRDPPGVGIGLLQLVRGAVDDELAELVQVGVGGDVAGERGAVVVPGELGERQADAAGLDLLDRAGHLADRLLEAALELGPESQQRGLPLPVRIDEVEGAVVQLVGDVEGELAVLR